MNIGKLSLERFSIYQFCPLLTMRNNRDSMKPLGMMRNHD